MWKAVPDARGRFPLANRRPPSALWTRREARGRRRSASEISCRDSRLADPLAARLLRATPAVLRQPPQCSQSQAQPESRHRPPLCVCGTFDAALAEPLGKSSTDLVRKIPKQRWERWVLISSKHKIVGRVVIDSSIVISNHREQRDHLPNHSNNTVRDEYARMSVQRVP